MSQLETQVNAVIQDETEESKIDLSIDDYYIVPQSCIEAIFLAQMHLIGIKHMLHS